MGSSIIKRFIITTIIISTINMTSLLHHPHGVGVGVGVGVGIGLCEATPTNQKQCYGELGCLELTEEWIDMVHRPLTYLPQERSQINTRFFLYHRNRTVDPPQVFLNRTNLLSEGFDPEKPIKFVTHGYLDHGLSFWMVQLPQALLSSSGRGGGGGGDFNVFAVDWGGGSHVIYTQAAANTRLVGLEIVHFVKFLEQEFGVKPSKVHCTGHSLGSHICAYVGTGVEGLGRITGLDPADPLFQYMPPVVRLSPDDAIFVDIVHTDGETILLGGLGFIEPCGHIDFYPNEGKSQPGCEFTSKPSTVIKTPGLDEASRELFSCDHHRAVFYFIEAIQRRSSTSCKFVGHKCPDWAGYLRGECWSCGVDGSDCAIMGLDADQYKIGSQSLVKFYFSTANSAPFCVHHYRVLLSLGHPKKMTGWVPGRLTIKVYYGETGESTDLNLTPSSPVRFYHGTKIGFVAQSPKELGLIGRVKLNWKYEQGYLDLRTTCLFYKCSNKLYVSRIDITDMDMGVLPLTTTMESSSSQDHNPNVEPIITVTTSLCGGEIGSKYVGIPSGTSAVLRRGPCRE